MVSTAEQAAQWLSVALRATHTCLFELELQGFTYTHVCNCREIFGLEDTQLLTLLRQIRAADPAALSQRGRPPAAAPFGLREHDLRRARAAVRLRHDGRAAAAPRGRDLPLVQGRSDTGASARRHPASHRRHLRHSGFPRAGGEAGRGGAHRRVYRPIPQDPFRKNGRSRPPKLSAGAPRAAPARPGQL